MSRKTKELTAARIIERQNEVRRRNVLLAGGAILAMTGFGWGFNALLSAPPTPAAKVAMDTKLTYQTDIVFGSQEAPVTVIEYASLTCPHCANFHARTLPDFIKGWVDTGKARLVYRHFPYDAPGLVAATAVSCLPKDKQKDAISALMKHQSRWVTNANPAEAALDLLVLSKSEVADAIACSNDGSKQEAVVSPANEARKIGVSGTPSFVVGNNLYVGFLSAEALGHIVEAVAEELRSK